MRCIHLILFATIFGGTWRLGRLTCVLESDFGFILNCAFKKSGLFRVRNLGGVKAHIGLGFSVGDELGFKESISNTEINRRRSVAANRFEAQLLQAQQKQKKANTERIAMAANMGDNSEMEIVPPMAYGKIRTATSTTEVPPFRPIPPAPERLFVTSNAQNSSEPVAVIAVPKKVIQESSKKGTNLFSDKMLSTSNKNFHPLALDMNNSIKSSFANNITEEMLESAIKQKNQMLNKLKPTENHEPKYGSSVGKVMNAPKEYYPVGYEKNFDDNFASRVELPDTSFHCGDQKHFPGLYADEDLGCMVFHVCALTEEGLIMKSFLCPESTLFDQTILKCNWWFYVDCKSSKKLYDSNIPISKSYQLMKALTFFSDYKKNSATPNSKNQAHN